MYINKAIRGIMKAQGVSLYSMAQSLGKSKGNDISARLNNTNMSFDKAVEMLNVLGYEIVIQERKQGGRRADQIIIDQKEQIPTPTQVERETTYDLDALLNTDAPLVDKSEVKKPGKIKLR